MRLVLRTDSLAFQIAASAHCGGADHTNAAQDTMGKLRLFQVHFASNPSTCKGRNGAVASFDTLAKFRILRYVGKIPPCYGKFHTADSFTFNDSRCSNKVTLAFRPHLSHSDGNAKMLVSFFRCALNNCRWPP